MIIAWDFDGVLNCNQANGRYVWENEFEREVGQSADAFGSFVFGRAPNVITGEIDLLERLEEWTKAVECRINAQEILALWLELDAKPDAEMLALFDELNQTGVRQIIATNNEARRADYIYRNMEMGARVEKVFASGPMGVGKPDQAFFAHITSELGVGAEQMFFIDDVLANVSGARSAGWEAFHFTPESRTALIEKLRSGERL